MSNQNLLYAIQASKVHKLISSYLKNEIKPLMTLKEIATLIENKIKEEIKYDPENPLLRGIGFPTGLSLNNCAAHYTPNSNDHDIVLTKDDIIKIDYGVHVKGVIIDSAFTLHFDPKYDEFINFSKSVTQYAVKLCKPDAILGEIGRDIEEYVKSKDIITIGDKEYHIKTMSDLSGHLIKPYEIHAGKAVPNIAIKYPLRMEEGEFYAIEPFITTGNGLSILREPNSHYMLSKNHDIINNLTISENDLYQKIKKTYSTLPFCQRWISEFNNIQPIQGELVSEVVEARERLPYELENLAKKTILNTYPPIYDIDNSYVSQFEHTIYIKSNGIINLTQNDFY